MKAIWAWMCLGLTILCFVACEKANLAEEIDDEDGEEVVVDTGGVSEEETDTIGDSSDETSGETTGSLQTGDAVTVTRFLNETIGVQVFVRGYIVGCAYRSRKNVYLAPPFQSRSSVLLAEKAGETDLDKMMSVNLKYEKMKAEVNLVDHPENYGKALTVFGYQGSYLGFTGMGSKQVSSTYQLE